MVDQTLHRAPCLKQSHAAVVKDIPVFISRILLVPGLKCKWSMNEIKIQIVDFEPGQTRLERWFNPFWPMIGVPQLCGNKDVFARNPAGSESSLQSFAHLTLVPISLRTIEVPKSNVQRVSGGSFSLGGIGNQGAKAQYGHMAGSVVERRSLSPKIRSFEHDYNPPVSRIQGMPGYSALFCGPAWKVI